MIDRETHHRMVALLACAMGLILAVVIVVIAHADSNFAGDTFVGPIGVDAPDHVPRAERNPTWLTQSPQMSQRLHPCPGNDPQLKCVGTVGECEPGEITVWMSTAILLSENQAVSGLKRMCVWPAMLHEPKITPPKQAE